MPYVDAEYTAVISPSTTQAARDRTLAVNLPPIALSAGRAREFVRLSLQSFGLPDAALADRVTLVASELVTNAVLHARTDLVVRLSADHTDVLLEVSDGGPLHDTPATCAPLATSGRGLVLVDSVADDWGMTGIDGGLGKTVWARVSAI
jgi:anti-sigma regulatory factor (Ser/Thr protein kinase)